MVEKKIICDLCGEEFIQYSSDSIEPGTEPFISNDYCSKCVDAIKIKHKIKKDNEWESWRSERKRLLKIKDLMDD